MLEDIAVRLVNQNESELQLLNFGIVIVGAVIAALFERSTTEIARAPYFAYSALTLFLASSIQIVWLASLSAVIGGYLWVFMLISLVAYAAAGFFFCRLAMARARDAFGHARLAFLAWIPIANFVLLLTPSEKALSANRAPTIPMLSGGLGVVTGFALCVASVGMSVYLEGQVLQMEQRAQSEPMMQQARLISLIRSNGLDGTLRMLANESHTPITVDEVTELARVEAVGTQLRRRYVVDLVGITITDEFRQASRNGICADPLFEPLFRAGATIRDIYFERSGREIGAIMISRHECGF